MATPSANEIISKAASQIGIAEIPINQVKYNDWYYGRTVNGSAYPWCAAFVSWVMNEVGGLSLIGGKNVAVRYILTNMRNLGLEVSTPKKGDIIFFVWVGDSQSNHIGFVESVNGSTVTTIEGNTSDAVMRVNRSTAASYKAYFCRPRYSASSSSNGSGGSSGSSNSSNNSSAGNSSNTYGTGTYQVVASSGLNVRKSATVSSAIVTALTKGAKVTVTSVSTSGQYVWGKISNGYIALNYAGNEYAQHVSQGSASNSSASTSSWTTGTYQTIVDALNVRTGAGTSYSRKSKNQLSIDGQRRSNASGQLNKGTLVTVSKVQTVGNEIWGQIPSGWIALYYGGEAYAKKV